MLRPALSVSCLRSVDGYFSLEFLPNGTLLAGGDDGGLYTIDPIAWNQTLIGFTNTDVLAGLEGVPQPRAEDWYSFTLAANQTTTLAVEGSDAVLDLLDSSGTPVASGVGSGSIDQLISNFTGTPGIYYARVTTNGLSDYNLVVTRDADFDSSINRDLASAQDIDGVDAVLGFTELSDDVYVVDGLGGNPSTLYRVDSPTRCRRRDDRSHRLQRYPRDRFRPRSAAPSTVTPTPSA